jgi:hypothetical protein
MFGGTGGHLHNVGFVFSLSNPGPVSQPATDPSIQLCHRLWQQMKTMGLWTHSPIGLFNATERESLQVERFAREDSWRHADYQGFVGEFAYSFFSLFHIFFGALFIDHLCDFFNQIEHLRSSIMLDRVVIERL